MKLVIQIPCLNEEATLPMTLAGLPKSLPGIDDIIIQIINDGSTDRTVEVAKNLGVKHIISFKYNRGLAAAFSAGIENALKLGADILINTDADSQYRGECIKDLIQPILLGTADIVVGARDINGHLEFSWLKKKLQHIGTWVVRNASGTMVTDAASGFRAYSRYAIQRLHIFSGFSYTLETLIQAGNQNLKVSSVPIQVGPKTRPSRLFRNIPHYLWKSGTTIINVFLIYRSMTTFTALSIAYFLTGSGLIIRYFWLIFVENAPRSAFWPSIIMAASFFLVSIQFYLSGIQALLISSNRKLLEEALRILREERQTTGEDQLSQSRSNSVVGLTHPSLEEAAAS